MTDAGPDREAGADDRDPTIDPGSGQVSSDESSADEGPPWNLAKGFVVGVALTVVVVGGLAVVLPVEWDATTKDRQRTPQVAMDFDYDASGDTLQVTHVGGDTFTGDNSLGVTVTVGDAAVPVALPFEAGDDVPLRSIDPGSTVRVVWTAPGGDKTTVIAQFEVPETDASVGAGD